MKPAGADAAVSRTDYLVLPLFVGADSIRPPYGCKCCAAVDGMMRQTSICHDVLRSPHNMMLSVSCAHEYA